MTKHMTGKRTIAVVDLPKRLTLRHIQPFLFGIGDLLNTDRPRIVFDLSQVREIDGAGTDMLLHCAEQVLRQDGSLNLASVPAEVLVVLELTRMDRLFEIFNSRSEAVENLAGIAS
jgi:anti-anti-sigma factor